MTVTHQEQVFQRAWAEHQQIRLLLAEIHGALGPYWRTEPRRADATSQAVPKPHSRRLRSLVSQLGKRFAYEGANGEVAITLACDRSLHPEVSALICRWKRLDRAIRDLLDALADREGSRAQSELPHNAFPRLSREVADYLSDRLDLLRRSLVNVRNSASVTV